MSLGPIRGPRPPVSPVTPKPTESASEKAAEGQQLQHGKGVLGPGQVVVLPARTGLAHYRDHFDARPRPDYEKALKGEVAQVKAEAPAEQPVVTDPGQPAFADDAQATAYAQDAALSMMDLLPPLALNPALVPIPVARPAAPTIEAEAEELDDPPEREPYEPEEPFEDEAEPELAFAPPEAPELEPREVEAQGGLFTLDEGSLDAREHRLCTLEAFLDGDVPFVSVAVDLAAIPYGAPLAIPALEAALGRPVPFRAVHETDRTRGVGVAYLEVCVSEPGEAARTLLERVLAIRIG